MKLLTFLGTGNYCETEYTWDKRSKVTCYAMVASASFLEADEIVIFVTEKAKESHEQPLRQALLSSQPEAKIEFVSIKEGKTESELWEIFSKVAQSVRPEDTVAFDVTHGLRSFPLIGLLAAAFLRSGLNINLKAVLYGAYDVRNQEVTPNQTPMFDLTPLLTLLQWAVAADRFNRSGDSRDFASLLKQQHKSLAIQLQNDHHRLNQYKPIQKLADGLSDISHSLALIRPALAMQQIDSLESQIETALPLLVQNEQMRPFRMLLETTQKTYQPLALANPEANPQQNLETQRRLIQWYAEREHWVQAVSLAREWLVSWVMFHLNKCNFTDENDRKEIEKKINKEADDLIKAKKHKKAFTPGELQELPHLEEVLGLWKALVDVRNDIDHAGMRPNPNSPSSLISSIEKHIGAIMSLPL